MFFDDNHLRTVSDSLSATKPEKVNDRKKTPLFLFIKKMYFKGSSSCIK